MPIAPGHIHRNTVLVAVPMDKRLRRITREFQDAIGNHQSQLARKLGLRSVQTVQAWFKLGRISPWGAMQIAKHFPEWPKERLRPDIIDWKSIKLRTPGRV